MSEVWTPRQAAEFFRVRVRTLTVWEQEGRFPPGAVTRTPGRNRRYQAGPLRDMRAATTEERQEHAMTEDEVTRAVRNLDEQVAKLHIRLNEVADDLADQLSVISSQVGNALAELPRKEAP